MTSDINSVVRAAVHGDVAAAGPAGRTSGEVDLSDTEADSLVLTSKTVASVLQRFVAGEISADDAQRWASLMRWGRMSDAACELTVSFEIEYEEQFELAIAESIGRLTELGDVVDGELRPGEAAELLRALEAVE